MHFSSSRSRDSSVCIVTRLQARRPRNRGSIRRRGKRFSLLHNVQTGYGTQPVSNTTSIGVYFRDNKATEGWNWTLPFLRTTLFAVCRIYTGRCHQQRDLDRHQLFGAYHLYIYAVQCGGQDGNLWHPCLYTRWGRYFTFDRNSKFSLGKKRSISFIRLKKNLIAMNYT
jgi:hypothetical protein